MLKRLFDLIASACGLLILSPLFLILAIWVKIDSIGPVFYRQVRVGRNNKDFRLFKFRSMKVDSDKTVGRSRKRKHERVFVPHTQTVHVLRGVAKEIHLTDLDSLDDITRVPDNEGLRIDRSLANLSDFLTKPTARFLGELVDLVASRFENFIKL